jgi:rSAM/selenodomain-associated transferase 2
MVLSHRGHGHSIRRLQWAERPTQCPVVMCRDVEGLDAREIRSILDSCVTNLMIIAQRPDSATLVPVKSLTPRVSVIIPVLNDAAVLRHTLERLQIDPHVELLVVNGESSSGDVEALACRTPHVQWIESAPGRGHQMNVGAAQARGAWLLFLHADTYLPDGWLGALDLAARDPTIVGGSFRFRLAARSRWARLLEWGVAARVRCFNLPYGDQALFVRRDVFESLGGYCELALMEDVEFVRRLRRAGRMHHSALPAVTSARRWETEGWIRRSAENVCLLLLYFLGVSPERLAKWYRRPLRKDP